MDDALGSLAEVRSRLATSGIGLTNGPFRARIFSRSLQVAEGVHALYRHHTAHDSSDFCDLTVNISSPRRLPFRTGRTHLVVDGELWCRPRGDLSYACLEWGMNWFVFRRAHHLLVLHSANLAYGDVGILMPADPGSGKSTLCAGLAHRGWRLMSDELTLIEPRTRQMIALARPICLKNESIPCIRDFAPEAEFGPLMVDSSQELEIAHLKPPLEAVRDYQRTATPRLIVFPRFDSDARQTQLTPVHRGQALIRVIQCGFNYRSLAQDGFQVLSSMIDECQCFDICYSDLEDAVVQLTELAKACST